MMNNREQIEQSVISASAYNGNDTGMSTIF